MRSRYRTETPGGTTTIYFPTSKRPAGRVTEGTPPEKELRALRFRKPTYRIVRRDQLPCEVKFWRRGRRRMLFVKEFDGPAFILDETGVPWETRVVVEPYYEDAN